MTLLAELQLGRPCLIARITLARITTRTLLGIHFLLERERSKHFLLRHFSFYSRTPTIRKSTLSIAIFSKQQNNSFQERGWEKKKKKS